MTLTEIRAALELGDSRFAIAELRRVLADVEQAGRAELVEWLRLLERAGGMVAGPGFAAVVRAARNAPDDPAALRALGRRLRGEAMAPQAVSFLSRAHRLAPMDDAVLAELVLALAASGEHARIASVLRDAPAPAGGPGLGRRGVHARHALLAGDRELARQCGPELLRSEDVGLRALGREIAGMLARAEAIAGVTPLDDRDLRGWHFVVTGGILLHEAPDGEPSVPTGVASRPHGSSISGRTAPGSRANGVGSRANAAPVYSTEPSGGAENGAGVGATGARPATSVGTGVRSRADHPDMTTEAGATTATGVVGRAGAGMNGRYGSVHDSYALCRMGLQRAQAVLAALGRPVTHVIAPGDRASDILAHAAATVLGCAVHAWGSDAGSEQAGPALIVAYDLDWLPPAARDALRAHRQGQIMFCQGASWTEEPPFAADLVTRLHRLSQAPWDGQPAIGGAPVLSNGGDVAALAARIADAPDPEPSAAAADLAALIALVEAIRSTEGDARPGALQDAGPRRRAWCGSPVPSPRFD